MGLQLMEICPYPSKVTPWRRVGVADIISSHTPHATHTAHAAPPAPAPAPVTARFDASLTRRSPCSDAAARVAPVGLRGPFDPQCLFPPGAGAGDGRSPLLLRGYRYGYTGIWTAGTSR